MAESDHSLRTQLKITRHLQEMRCLLNGAARWRANVGQEVREAEFMRVVREYAWILSNSHTTLHQTFLYLKYVHKLAERLDISDPGPNERYMAPKLRDAIKSRDGYVCHYCKQTGDEQRGPDGRPWHIDHLTPVSRGGTDEPSNLVVSCATCNIDKNTMTADEYKAARVGQQS